MTDSWQDILAFAGSMACIPGDREHTSIWNSAIEWDHALIAGGIMECLSFSAL